ncbi:MAG TPA: HNH endonuclease signature motif containing protein [Vicinamibacterales bacterium]|jgi:hypothetical protein|nr:HNH endonuclease signature motif containing protein [Vicinamibacterales bacterium]
MRNRVFVALALVVSLLAPSSLYAKGSGGTVHVKGYTKKDGIHVNGHDRKPPKSKGTTSSGTSSKTSAKHTSKAPAVVTASGVERDEHGRIKRSEFAKHAFEVQSGYPHGRPGYVVDHIRPLACGGADDASNMQWQTVVEAKAKDKYERAGCR